jgi:hypothetical protein
MASEALGLLPGEMQEQFPAVPGRLDIAKPKKHLPLPAWEAVDFPMGCV